jgi:hypothetical protein
MIYGRSSVVSNTWDAAESRRWQEMIFPNDRAILGLDALAGDAWPDHF